MLLKLLAPGARESNRPLSVAKASGLEVRR